MPIVDVFTDWIGTNRALDAPAKGLQAAAKRVLPEGPATDVLSGKQLGHPLHPALVAVPMGSFLSATVLDFAGGQKDDHASQRLLGLGLLATLPTAIAGLSDWRYTYGAERRVGLVHAVVNTAALSMYTASLVARRRGNLATGKMLSLLGSGLLGAGGALGGHLAYALGVGVVTNAFGDHPTTWTPVVEASKISEVSMLPVDVNGVRVLVTKVDGEIRAIANRCSHRGGPLNVGERKGGCVECPWHGSQFDLETGAVVRGPAVRPQPKFDVRIHEGKVEIRRSQVHPTTATNSDAAH